MGDTQWDIISLLNVSSSNVHSHCFPWFFKTVISETTICNGALAFQQPFTMFSNLMLSSPGERYLHFLALERIPAALQHLWARLCENTHPVDKKILLANRNLCWFFCFPFGYIIDERIPLFVYGSIFLSYIFNHFLREYFLDFESWIPDNIASVNHSTSDSMGQSQSGKKSPQRSGAVL